ncbi:MAG: choice-of-anchor D domain-containing protein, partial [Bacteroidota bacterium]
GRFCSADLAAPSAFYNVSSGLGTQEKIFLTGEETGSEGRLFGHIVTGTEAGTSYELPRLGKFSWENAVASPNTGNKTLVLGMDDSSPGQVYAYIGTKTNTGTDIDKAGFTNGNLYGIAVTGLATETSSIIPTANTTFSLVNLGDVTAVSGSSLNANSITTGVTNFLRPEDGAWDPSNPSDFYFVTTNSFTAPSRLWRLRFTNIATPELGGTITAVLDGTEGQKMLDNLTIDYSGHVLLQEDPGNQAHLAKVWQYDIPTDVLTLVGEHTADRFTTGGANFLTQDEESSGIIDVQSILGAGNFILVDQAHYSLPNPMVEGGQLLAFYNPTTAQTNPEINLKGNAVSIVNGETTISATNNTDFGSVGTNTNTVKSFIIENNGVGTLVITGVNFAGAQASDFSVVGSSSFTIQPSSSQTISVRFTPAAVGVRAAKLFIGNNDFDENRYNFNIQGNGVVPTGIRELELKSQFTLYPNPVNNEVYLTWNEKQEGLINISVYDIQGKLVLKPIQQLSKNGENTLSISTTNLVNGIYFIQVSSEGKTNHLKLEVIH